MTPVPGRGSGPASALTNCALWAAFSWRCRAPCNFLFADPSDQSAAGQALGNGDGATVDFPLVRSFGTNGFAEPMLGVQPTPNVYLNGVKQTSGWSLYSSLGYTNVGDYIQFASPPAAGAAVTADFSYFFLCHFADDSIALENFLYQLWQAKEVKFESVLL